MQGSTVARRHAARHAVRQRTGRSRVKVPQTINFISEFTYVLYRGRTVSNQSHNIHYSRIYIEQRGMATYLRRLDSFYDRSSREFVINCFLLYHCKYQRSEHQCREQEEKWQEQQPER